ncbi:alpha/beta hydrolase [Lactococcus termiticola]|uniref:Esterase/lipase n=1 Tax=Lactococcus termiticola TaxID=2169526 RepID=A0A2R5HH85_9LACT|nr:alpha/beta hydrolase [Lactococcus termiticola]GBG97342.1 esterase/lipase [Lactococcus termiticola]
MEERYIKGSDGRKLRLLIFKGKKTSEKLPAYLWFHGGGYAMGSPEMAGFYAERLIAASPCIMIAPDYSLSTEKPYPAALEDAYASLYWLFQEADDLGIRREQIFVGGDSAGGGLAASLSLYARDKGEINIAFQTPLYPMLDDRMETASAKMSKDPAWNPKMNEIAWRMYLGDLKEATSYAAPAREEDFKGLPPTYTFVGDLEIFHDETIAYIEKLKKAGVSAKIDVYKGCYHGFDRTATAVGEEAVQGLVEAYLYARKHYFSKQK